MAGAKQGASALDYAANVVKAARVKRQRDPSMPLRELVNVCIAEYNQHVSHNSKYQISGCFGIQIGCDVEILDVSMSLTSVGHHCVGCIGR